MIDISRHPCFNDASRHSFGRVHLPIAPKCNVQCNFCNRRYDCLNESRPGVTSSILTPGQAMSYLEKVIAFQPNIAVVGIAGPGDPFANPDETMETLRRVRAAYPEMILCVATNGLGLLPYVDELAELEVSHVTVTVNAVDPEIGKDVYAWIRDGKRPYRGIEGARRLLERQLAAIKAAKVAGLTVKINSILIPGVNDEHIPEIARRMSNLGVDIFNCIGLYSVPGTAFEDIASPSDETVAAVRRRAGEHIPLMHHCTRCRADAVGLLGKDMPAELVQAIRQCAAGPVENDPRRTRVAVASLEGMIVNQHLGEASSLRVYQSTEGRWEMVEARHTPPAGGGDQRWKDLAATFSDCHTLLCSGAGPTPVNALKTEGIRVIVMEGLVEEALDAIARGQPIRSPKHAHSCGSGCAGDGTGCG
jgi:nitrogen fixation protein NifB